MDKNLQTILELHEAWFDMKAEGKRANLNRADLRNIDLQGVILCGADLSGAILSDTNLSKANLGGAILRKAVLCCTNLSEANLHGADLTGAYLCDAHLCNANMCKANLNQTILINANLYQADLTEANLCKTDLRGTNLCKACLIGANVNEIKYNEDTAFYAPQCPEEGSFIGYKTAQGMIIKLEITADAKRSSATSRKCRCNKAKVLSITSPDGKIERSEVFSNYDPDFVYRVGEMVSVNDFDDDRWNECSTGIHFFIRREEAVQYMSN